MGHEVTARIDEVRKGYTRTRQLMERDMADKRYPLQAEPALIHPQNTSVVKVRDNGTIDLFVGTDNGIRIDPNARSITALSNSYNAKNRYDKAETERDKTVAVGMNETHTVGNAWTVNAGAKVHIVSGGSITMEAATRIDLKAPVVRIESDTAVQLSPFPPHSHPEYERGSEQ